MGSFGGSEILIVVVVLLLFFGARKIPELARGIGEGITEFKKASDIDATDNDKNEKNQQSDSNEVKQTPQ